jgi:hypothetical protein
MTTKIYNTKIKSLFQLGYLLVISLLLFQCSKKNDMASDKSWVRVYDHSNFNLLFYSLDVAELPDNNLLVLASSKMDTALWPTPYLLCTNKEGIKQWTISTEAYNSPVPNIIKTNGEYYFFCMDNALGTHVLKINTSGGEPSLFKSFNNLTYPLYAIVTSDNKVLLTSYNRFNRSTVLTCFDSNFSVIWSKEYSGVENYEEKVRLHLTRQGPGFPFFVGEITTTTNNYYFVNGFYNFIFSLLFINKISGDIAGIINGIPYSAAASSLISRNDTSFILTRYDENQNYINIRPTINFTSISNITAMGGVSWPELSKNATIKPIKTIINNEEAIVLNALTRSNQVLLLFFDPKTGKLKNSKYLGSSNPVNLASVISTLDGGLAVLTQIYIAGRFPRIQLFKIPPEQLVY